VVFYIFIFKNKEKTVEYWNGKSGTEGQTDEIQMGIKCAHLKKKDGVAEFRKEGCRIWGRWGWYGSPEL